MLLKLHHKFNYVPDFIDELATADEFLNFLSNETYLNADESNSQSELSSPDEIDDTKSSRKRSHILHDQKICQQLDECLLLLRSAQLERSTGAQIIGSYHASLLELRCSQLHQHYKNAI
ncbi:MAG: hypothetical protein KC505_07395 [Myxococcales bacterium]|nr:hypothetical protein [Myxococcales bacterium]USN50629.1 MAG: hypothetical protein H6731_10260 [Myxococcales bacterium]